MIKVFHIVTSFDIGGAERVASLIVNGLSAIEGNEVHVCVFEDSNKCVAMWRSEGLLTCQVENSDY